MSPSSSGSRKKARNQREAGIKQNLLGLFFDPKDGGDMLLQNMLTFSGLHGVISRKIELFMMS
jgi:hypothetical protein